MGCQLLKNALRRSRHAFDVAACAVTRADVLNSVNLRSIDVALIGEDLEDGRSMGFQVLRELHVSHPETKRSEEHTSELQSLAYLVCRLLLEKKKQRRDQH